MPSSSVWPVQPAAGETRRDLGRGLPAKPTPEETLTVMRILVTGGNGYIGSHMCVELLREGYDVVALDNLSRSRRATIHIIQRLSGRMLDFVLGDVRDPEVLAAIFRAHEIHAVCHFAGMKAVGESVMEPRAYYENNVSGTLRLLAAMAHAEVKTLVFSSSAAVYGNHSRVPIAESSPAQAVSPYGRTKHMVEGILQDLWASDPSWRISVLRYFNPAGAHVSGELGEDPCGSPAGLLPRIGRVAAQRLPYLPIFGGDYPTPDGTGIRDYIHVVDLVRGHLKALEFLREKPRISVHNLGTGTGCSVLEALAAFERTCGRSLPYKIVGRRAGDPAESYGDSSKARRELGWVANYTLDRMCEDAWRWQRLHPCGVAP